MAVPQGYTPLAKVGTLDRGTYSASATYNKLDFVYYNGSSWIAQKDGMSGITPEEGDNWHYFAKGFTEADATGININDTSNLLGTGTGKTTLQKWGDKVADWLVNKCITNDNFVAKLTERLVNNGTTTAAGFALDARYGKSLQDAVNTLNSGVAKTAPNLIASAWSAGKANAYIKCAGKKTGDSFLPYFSIPTKDGTWIVGTYNISNQLAFCYAPDSGDQHTIFLSPTDKDKSIIVQ